MERNNTKDSNSWVKIVQRYNTPDSRSWWQILNSLGPYILLWILMYYSLSFSYYLTLFLSFIAGGFLIRIFIIFHDCGHGSFFKSAFLRRFVGTILGLFMFTPYDRWHYDHLIHHQTVGNLDKKGVGDVRTFTVEEYIKFTKFQRILYRISRHPIMLFVIGPLLLFVVIFRFPFKMHPSKIRWNTHFTTLLLVGIIYFLSQIIGFWNFVIIQTPILFFASTQGIWLFYIQHQFEDVTWKRQKEWDYKTVALQGSSYLKLPKLIQWFSGNIGFHHIHHLSPAIPNYKLEECYNENPAFHVDKPLTFFSSIKCLKYRLWDEENEKLISFSEFRKIYGHRLLNKSDR
jgi:omega-6 fatty acid desaturase (delta-12 desaturase)